MKKLILILVCCAMSATIIPQTKAGQLMAALRLTDYYVMVANNTTGYVAIYLTGESDGIRGYINPGTGNGFGPITAGTYSVLMTSNLPGLKTFTFNGVSITTTSQTADFGDVYISNNVYGSVD
ncbi:hypothetical protein [uncultured Chitinophaga sp.]|uniref:hypothetical protein n=1 Tax=uncultured Chitinophaga sp. TaxID=339340 RepID=UPI0025CEC924|nr:hypothetical protein [uncultured Chitinophaga sp.]